MSSIRIIGANILRQRQVWKFKEQKEGHVDRTMGETKSEMWLSR